jgi:DNA-binding HxlR family transcriptional regulator
VEYRLTALGRSLLDPLSVVRAWAWQHIDEIERVRVGYDRNQE